MITTSLSSIYRFVGIQPRAAVLAVYTLKHQGFASGHRFSEGMSFLLNILDSLIFISLYVLSCVRGHFLLPTYSVKLRGNPSTLCSFPRGISDTIYCREDSSDHSLVRLSTPCYSSYKHRSGILVLLSIPTCVFGLLCPSRCRLRSKGTHYIVFFHFMFSVVNYVLNYSEWV